MAISSTIHKNNFLYLLIIATFSVPITISLMFNLLTDSTTNFSLFMDSSDGLCFDLDRNSSLVTTGRATELSQVVKAFSSFQVPAASIASVAMEFDINWNANWDHAVYQRDIQFEDYEFWEMFEDNIDYSLAPKTYVITLVYTVAISVVLIWAILSLYNYLCKKKRPSDEEDQIADQVSTESFESCSPRPFTFEELSRATNNFSRDLILGVGGFGAVYKAILPNGKKVAVKRVSNTSQQGIKEYKAEVTIISRSNHRNLVQLIGWCHEREGELLVVYELMENRSLDVYLFNSDISPLAWDVRYKIAQGLARALHYLHEECGQHCVLHMDIKSSNVLLDSNFEPKLSDFGLARLVDHGRSMEVSTLAGTRGYLAPECALTGKVSMQSDVYSYGVVALELATGRKTIDPNAEEDQKLLVKWVQRLYSMDRILEAVDPKLDDDYDVMQVKGLMVVGLWCVLHDFHKRPSMKDIVRVLDNTQDPLSDLHQKIPSLVHDSVPRDFDSILETCSTASDLTVYLEMETPLPIEPEDRTYSPLFVWRHITFLGLLRYLIRLTRFRS